MPSFLDRLKTRKLVEWMLAYLAGAWLVMQLIEVLGGRWALPLGLQRGIDMLLVVGFFVALTIAWYHGEKGFQRVTGMELLILAALLFVGGGVVRYVSTSDLDAPAGPSPGPALTAAGTQGIAVLPLHNLSSDSSQDYFVSGMHEALIGSLARIDGLRVISRTSVMRYTDTDKPLPEIARELGVATVIEGSVNPVDDRVRITVQLIDGAHDSHIWSEEYDRDLRDVLVLMSQVAASVAEQVEVALSPEDEEILGAAQPVDPELHDLFLRARYALGSGTPEGLAQAIRYHEEAIQKDSTFALAWAGYSGTQVLRAYLGQVPASEVFPEAERAARRALELDDGISEAHTAIGWIWLFTYQWEAARRALERALAINPNDVDALHGFGDYLSITGSLEDGLAYVERARDVDPFSPMWGHAVIGHLVMMDRYEDALAEAEVVAERFPNAPLHVFRGTARWALGMEEEALEDFRVVVSRRPALREALEAGYERSGTAGALSAVADAAAEDALQSGAGDFAVALWYGRAGNADRAMEWLDRAFEDQAPDLIYVALRPELHFLHDDPRFHDLLGRMGVGLVD
jgi:TolB-like protein/tetratricopeptide (TPR) repeat protein